MTTSGHEIAGCATVVAALALVQLVTSLAVAPRPTPPLPSIPATGAIAFSYAGQTWEMDANDGSITIMLAHHVVKCPSLGTYADMRWELVAKQTGQFYHVQHPDGTIVKVPHRDLFARGVTSTECGNMEVQLTDFYGTYSVEKGHWCHSDVTGADAFISLSVTDVSRAVIGLVDGRYVLRGAGADESIAEVVPVIGRLLITGRDLIDISSPLTPEESRYETILVGEDRNAIPFHAWSPNGAYLAFMPTNPLAIHVVDVRSPPVYQRDAVLLPETRNAFWDEGSWSNPYAWSPDSTRILYKRCGAIRAVNPFTWQYDVLVQDSSVAGNAYQPLWSPDGEHIVFLVKSRGDFEYSCNVFRTRLSDGATVRLTDNLDNRVSPGIYSCAVWLSEVLDVDLATRLLSPYAHPNERDVVLHNVSCGGTAPNPGRMDPRALATDPYRMNGTGQLPLDNAQSCRPEQVCAVPARVD